MIRTGSEYLEGLNDGRDVRVGGDKVDNVATHPKTRDYAQRIADFYDLHHHPELEDKLTFVDEDGERRSMGWFQQRDKDQLRQKREFYETIMRHLPGGASAFHRTPDVNNAVLLTYVDDPEPWQEAAQGWGVEGRPLVDNMRNYWQFFRDNDLNTGPVFVDPQTDRGRDEAHKEGPALRVVDSDDEGIVVNGVKAIGTGTAFSDWIHIGCFFRPGIPAEQIIFGVTPTNTPGVTIVCRESTVKDDPLNHPLSSLGDELDNTVVFNQVKIPWENVFHVGAPEHAMLYPQRVFDWLHYHIIVRGMVRSELMTGLALLMTESIGTLPLPPVKTRVARFSQFHQAMKAFVYASEELGFHTPGGHWKANILQVDMGRAYWVENLAPMTQELLDLGGRSSLIFPSEEDWQDSELRKWLEPLQTGPTKQPYDRMKISRVIRDLFLTDWGRRQAMFENFQGTPLMMIRLLTMLRADFSGSGSEAEFARRVCGIQLEGEEAETEYLAQADYARAQDAAGAAR